MRGPLFTWKMAPRETGLRAIFAGPRSHELWMRNDAGDTRIRVATVSALRRGYETVGWYWVARADDLGIPLLNSCGKPASTVDEAKAQARAYVAKCLAAAAAAARKA